MRGIRGQVTPDLPSDAVNAYAWDARNQLASINMAAFAYDSFGRRILDAAGTAYLYDKINSVQELRAATPVANILSGRVDESFLRSDTNGNWVPLSDALQSTVALTDMSASLQTQYTYDPYGSTIGATSGRSQYTGRDNDGGGIYYYRRYYSPAIGRFISQDPIGFSGGMNQYAYADGNPMSFRDPMGLETGNLNKLVPGPNGEGVPGPTSGRKDNPLVIRRKGQTFGDCMKQHAQDYSIAGVIDLTLGTDIQSDPLGAFFLGNHVAGPAFGSGGEAAMAGVHAMPTAAIGGMGSTLAFGRYASDIALDLSKAGNAATSALGWNTNLAAMGALEDVETVFNLGLSLETRLGTDIGFTLAEAAGCAVSQ